MNCKTVQQEMLDRLAAGEATLPAEFTVHQESCAACRDYYASQLRLFESIDQAVGLMANVSVPPSLLPMVRARVLEQSVPRPHRFYGWLLTGIGISALAAVIVAFFLHRPGSNHQVPEVARQIAPEGKKAGPTIALVAPLVTRHSLRISKPRVSSVPAAAVDEPTQEVIVLAEERDAFAHFVANVPDNPVVAVALTHPVPEERETTVEIALLTIKPLELKSLEPSEE